jgi:hypothetical protein
VAANARITPPLQGVSSTREDACECRRTGKRSGSALHSDHYDRRRAALSPSADRSGNEREPGQWPDSRQYVSASPGTGKSHVAKALALGAVSRGYKVIYREAHHLIEDINEARELGEIRKYRAQMKSTELLVIDDLFLRKLPASAGDELADVLMSRYEKSSTIITSNRPFEDWAKLLGDVVVVTPLLDRLMHHGHLLKFEGKSWRLKEAAARIAKRGSTH